MEVVRFDELEETEINFDRYEAQLVKIAKGNTLSTFAMDTCEKEFKRIKDIVSHISTFVLMECYRTRKRARRLINKKIW